MKNAEEALKAIEELDECQYDNSTIVVSKAKPKTDAPKRDNKFGGKKRF